LGAMSSSNPTGLARSPA